MRLLFTQTNRTGRKGPQKVLPAVLCRELFKKEIEAAGNENSFYNTVKHTNYVCPNTTETSL